MPDTERNRSARRSARGGAGKRRADAAQRFLAALAAEAQGSDLGAAVEVLLDGVPSPNADLAGAAVALGAAVDALGSIDTFPIVGPALVLVTVPTAAWVEPVIVVLRHHVEAARRGRLSGYGDNCSMLFVEGVPPTYSGSMGKRDAEVLVALRSGSLVVGVSQDPPRLLPGNLVRGAECRIALAPLDPDAIRFVIAVVTGEMPRDAVPIELARVCEPDDLVLAVHAVRGPDASASRLTRLLEDKAGPLLAGPRLEDLHGYGEAKEWGLALVQDLRSWRSGVPGCPRWSDLESAILLSGPTGVGKTTFAAALARSAGLPFLAGLLAQWQSARDGHLGHTLGAMRAFFDRASRAPCIVLIDEVDSFGDRATLTEHHRDYSTQVVNALLEALDGAASREGVVVVAATNNPDRLDPALLRSGRLERHVRIGLPDKGAIAGILRHNLGAALEGADLSDVALRLQGMSGAEIEGLVRRARGVARRGGRPLTQADLDAVVEVARPPLPSSLRARVAAHEAGHLVAAAAIGAPGPLSASIAFDGGIACLGLGPDWGIANEEQLDEYLVVMLAGRAAEDIVLGDITTGSVEDLAGATRLAVSMETQLGFSAQTPLISFGRRDPADALSLPWVASAVHNRLILAYERALDLLRVHRRKLDRLSAKLCREGQLDDVAVRRLLGRLSDPRRRRRRSCD